MSLDFYNKFHLGDCLVSIHFLNKLLDKNNLNINFYCNIEYHNQLKEFISLNNKIKLLPIESSKGTNLWCGEILHKVKSSNEKNYPFFCFTYPELEDVLKMVYESYKLVSAELNLVFPFKNKYDVIFDEEILSEEPKIGYFDYLIINSDCKSGQVSFSIKEQDEIFYYIIDKIKQSNKSFITTKKLGNYPCTLDENLSIVEIGQLSKKAIKVIGVPTSLFWITLNKFAIFNKTKFINITQDSCTYEIETNVETIKGTTSELINFFNNQFTL
jgi:hypothetical protein